MLAAFIIIIIIIEGLAAFSLLLVLSLDIFWLIFVLFLAPVVFAFLFSFVVPWEAVGFSAAYTHTSW